MIRVAAALLTICLLPAAAVAQTVQEPPRIVTLPSAADAAQGPPVGLPTIPSFRKLFSELGHGFRRLPSRDSAIVLGVAGALSLGVHARDRAVTQRVALSAPLDRFFEIGDVAGGGVQVGGAIATYLLGRAAHRTRVAALGADLVQAQIVNTVLTQGLKLSVGRQRPDGSRFSFPSGHTSSTFATASVLQRHFGWKVGVPAYALAGYVAGSRLQENKHFPSDVIFGAAVGIVSGRAVTVGRGRATFAVSPIATRGGGGIAFTRVGAR